MSKRKRRNQRLWQVGAWALVPLATTSAARAQVPVPPSGPASSVMPRYGFTDLQPSCKDTFIGRPELFYEPPPGFYVNQYLSLMQARADPHRFTLYQTDFLPGTNRLSPTGATRFSVMAKRLPQWLGPVLIEWSPDYPGLAEARRAAVLETLQRVGVAMIPERVVIAPSPYPGLLGADGNQNYTNMISRDNQAPQGLPLTPASNSISFGPGGGGGGGGGGAGP
jgi:hypothetical protein